MNAHAQRLLSHIAKRQARVAIIGMGYVGFPLAQAVHRKGFSVIAYDIDEAKISRLKAGSSYIEAISDEELAALLSSGRFMPTHLPEDLKTADAILICVPTPLLANGEPDVSHIRSTGQMLAAQLQPGQLVSLESTTYPGTTQELLRPMLEAGGRVCGQDFFLAYSPEREDPGNHMHSLNTIPKVVCGADDISHQVAVALYESIVSGVVPVSSMATAEAVKLTENIFRAVNIAMINELKTVYTALGIDIWEVVQAAASKPFGYMPFYPGPGVGGHCIPVDPFYLSWKAQQHGADTPLIALAGRINHAMPAYVIGRLQEGLLAQGRKLAGARILLLGLAYKADVDDVRESPGLVLYDQLAQAGAKVDYHDPYVQAIPPTRNFPRYAGAKSVKLEPAQLEHYDAALVISGHRGIDYTLVAAHLPLIVDTRNLVPTPCRAQIIKA
ncbi:MAG: nucleotide sugar dehydrogenase [Alphaproteobacteria bacterium]|nr:nucleotide sugar dehydrogenase [Alphaproteobacteria bacterium]